MNETLSRFTPMVFAITRLMVGLLFLEHGLVKLIGFPAGAYPGQQALMSFAGLSAVIELVCGLLIAVGLFTRIAAFLASGEMAVGYFIAHAVKGFFPAANGGDGAILFCFFFLYVVFAGPGVYSLDALVGRQTSGVMPGSRVPASP